MAGCESIAIAVSDCARHGSCEVKGQFWRHFDRRRDDLWRDAVEGKINRIDCDDCGRRFGPPAEFVYTDMKRGIGVIVSPVPMDGQVAPAKFAEVLLATEAGVTSAALAETKALLAAVADTPVDRASLKLAAIGEMLLFEDDSGNTVSLAPLTVGKVMAQQTEARQTLASRRARRRRRIGDPRKAAGKFLAAFAQKMLGDDLDDKIAAVQSAIEAGFFTRDQAYAMAYLARRPQAHQFDRAESFALFEDMTGIELSDELEKAKARTGLPVLAALWYAYAQLPDNARRRHGLGLERIETHPSTDIAGQFDTGLSAADPDRVLLSFGAIKSSLFARVLRHELAHALHDNNAELIDAWLTEHFGWRVYQLPVDAYNDSALLIDAVDGWVAELGGWGIIFLNVTNEEDKQVARRQVWLACQPQIPAREGKVMSRWADDLTGEPGWFSPSFAEQVYANSPDDWWKFGRSWISLPNDPGRTAYMCHQYRQLVVIDVDAVSLVCDGFVPQDYALMSQKEFFAELYTYWHWRANDKQRRRQKLRKRVPKFHDLLSQLDIQQALVKGKFHAN